MVMSYCSFFTAEKNGSQTFIFLIKPHYMSIFFKVYFLTNIAHHKFTKSSLNISSRLKTKCVGILWIFSTSRLSNPCH